MSYYRTNGGRTVHLESCRHNVNPRIGRGLRVNRRPISGSRDQPSVGNCAVCVYRRRETTMKRTRRDWVNLARSQRGLGPLGPRSGDDPKLLPPRSFLAFIFSRPFDHRDTDLTRLGRYGSQRQI